MRKRADMLLVERGFFASRARAQEAIAAGLVSADGIVVRKASENLAPDAAIVAGAPHPWVSRGGVKLAAALDAFALDPAGLLCLDVGASTGGFTDVLLTRGARAVVERRRRPRPVRRRARRRPEGDAARRARRAPPDARDRRRPAGDRLRRQLHFAAPRAAARSRARRSAGLARQPRQAAIRGRGANISSRAPSRTPPRSRSACEAVRRCVEELGWTSLGLIPSPVLGGDGAREFLYAARHG